MDVHSLMNSIKLEFKKLQENHNFKTISPFIKDLRQSFVSKPFNQKLICENDDYLHVLLNLLNYSLWKIRDECNVRCENQQSCGMSIYQSLSSDKESLCDIYDFGFLCSTLVANLMVANSFARNLLWPHMKSLTRDILQSPDYSVRHIGGAIFHQFLTEENLKNEIVTSNFIEQYFPLLLNSYLIPGKNSSISLFAIQILIKYKECLNCWKNLKENEALLLLDILIAEAESNIDSLDLFNIDFFVEFFKIGADKIFKLKSIETSDKNRVHLFDSTTYLESERKCIDENLDKHKNFRTTDNNLANNPAEVCRTTKFLSFIASSIKFKNHLQKDKSLLISSVFLLKALSDFEKMKFQDKNAEIQSNKTDFQDNKHETELTSDKKIEEKNQEFANTDKSKNCPEKNYKLEDSDEVTENNPVFGFKTDLIRLIAALVYRNSSNQDTVRDLGGILLILSNSGIDNENPLMRETSIYAMRNLLENNLKNQKIVTDLEFKEVVKNDVVDKLGMSASVENGVLKISQK